MRRRRLCALAGTALLGPLAGCSPCGETWPGLGFAVAPTGLARDGDGWRVEATLRLRFAFGREGTGMDRAALAAFDGDGRVVGRASLGDLDWADVPADRRESGSCGTGGHLERTATLRSRAFPQWVGVRYDVATRSYTEARRIAAYAGRTPVASPSATDYEPVAVETLAAGLDETTPRPPVEDLSFDVRERGCHTPDEPTAGVRGTTLSVEHGRSLPAERYRPALVGYEHAPATLALDVGVRGRPRLRRRDCPASRYVVRLAFATPADRPERVLLRHRDPDGEVTSTHVASV